MQNSPRKQIKKRKRSKFRRNRALIITAGTLLIILVALLLTIPFLSRLQAEMRQQTPSKPAEQTEAPTTDAIIDDIDDAPMDDYASEPTIPMETQPKVLPYLADIAASNSDMVGWIKVDNTKLDYPLMFTPDYAEEYIHKDINGKYSVGGLPFIEGQCSLDPRSDNLIIYGHNMKNGTMFATLMDYAKESFWQEHPLIHMSSLYEETPYEVFAAFYDRVYYQYETCFKFYQFIDAQDETDFNNAIQELKSKSIYDTGITPEYGDQLITLVTCSYHEENGRFVVVARAPSNSESE